MHAMIPLALLEALQGADVLPDGNDADGPFAELAATRFGGSATVAAQIQRYADLAGRDADVDAEEVIGLLRLVARRPDADLVLADAGRRAGRRAARCASRTARLLMSVSPSGWRRRIARRVVRHLGDRLLDLHLEWPDTIRWRDRAGIGRGDLAGVTCRMVGAAAAELVRAFVPFEGALFHVRCGRDGDEQRCAWSTERPPASTGVEP